MRLSESLRRGIMETSVGGIINKFVMKRRRITLFFEDISANYLKLCEEKGYAEEMQEIGKQWGMLTTKALAPDTVKRLPVPLLSEAIKLVWANLGIIEGFQLNKTGDTVVLTTKRDAITRIIGKNSFATGCFNGVLNIYMDAELQITKVSQSTDVSEYSYKIVNKGADIMCKNKDMYNRLNSIPYVKGYTLKDAIRSNILQLSGNRIYFRGKSICYSENTVFHIIGNKNILLDEVPRISYNYFKNLIDKDTQAENKLLLLKTLLQTMGWGIVNMINGSKSVTLEISYLPCGLQLEKENWNFLVMTILGYLWTIDPRMKVIEIKSKSRRINVKFGH